MRHFRERYTAYLAGNPRNQIEPALQGTLGGPLSEYFVSRDEDYEMRRDTSLV